MTAIAHPSPEHLAELSARTPQNPFVTAAYAAARRDMGAEPWLLTLQDGTRLLTGCLAFLRRGRLTRSLEVPSWPGTAQEDLFEAVLRWCRARSVSRLELQTFGSDAGRLPAGRESMSRRLRAEYLIDLTVPEWGACLSSHHARHIKRAQKAGLILRRTREPAAGRLHLGLMQASLARRRARGEAVEGPAVSVDGALTGEAPALLAHGAGEVFQACVDDQPLSSILVLRATAGGYYHSAGTTVDGMNLGASHWLVHRVTQILHAEGLQRFNLGGASEEGLVRFKAGFGAVPVELEAGALQLATPLVRAVVACARALETLAAPIRLLHQPRRGAPSTGAR